MALMGFFGPVECAGTANSHRNISFINPPVGHPGVKLAIESPKRRTVDE
jgi:hypothetical protein